MIAARPAEGAAGRARTGISLGRRVRHRTAVVLVWLSVAIVLLPLAHMFAMVTSHAVRALSPKLFTTSTAGVAGASPSRRASRAGSVLRRRWSPG